MSDLQDYFASFREQVVGEGAPFSGPFGAQKVRYADWIASGRLYRPIEERMLRIFGPYVGNTHTETTETGGRMTRAYHQAQKIIKRHVHAGPRDVIITAGFGMTAVVNKLQRILGFKGCAQLMNRTCLREAEKPVVFLTHMEHHSNHTSWYETLCDVVVVPPDEDLLVKPCHLERELERYRDRKYKIGSFTACSNVTGVRTPYHELARLMHRHGGICFVDFAASAPYDPIDMHPEGDPEAALDGIFFSPHKFLGGPGSPGIMIFDGALYQNKVPDHPGGGTVDWTNPWGEYKYVDDIEAREDGGTPGFLQTIRAAQAILLKEAMGPDRMVRREEELLALAFPRLRAIPGLHILADTVEHRLGVISFYVDGLHYNLLVRLLNDRFGFQVRGGCACAGTYGHFLLHVNRKRSHDITRKISQGDLSEKPGWVRWSLHPVMTDRDILDFCEALEETVQNASEWANRYQYNAQRNEYIPLETTSADAPSGQATGFEPY